MSSHMLKVVLHPLDEIIERAVSFVGDPSVALKQLRGEWMVWRAATLKQQSQVRAQNETAPDSGESSPTPLRSI